MAELPGGTVTFLFTDIEGSTALWQRDRHAMQLAVERHIAMVGKAVNAHGGVLFKIVGDATQSAFATTPDGLAAAIEAQRALMTEPQGHSIGPLRVRMALHAGEAFPRRGDYLSAPLNRLSRLLATGHGRQILITQAVQQLARDALPPDVKVRDLGTQHLRDLQETERVFQIVAPGLPESFPPLRGLASHPTNLTAPPTKLIGREEELAALVQLLAKDGARLVTLTGAGGTGKTRLAQEIASALLGHYPEGVFFVDLAPLTDGELVVPTIAATLGLREAADQGLGAGLARVIGQKQLLLLLDNCERVLQAASDIAALLAACPQIAILATSRESWHIRGEREVPVRPLDLPDPAHLPEVSELARVPAIALFTERATASQPDFALTTENASAIAAICRRLDGLPLAIEFAAARVKALPPSLLLARLEQRLPLLGGGARDLPARQRTMRDAIAWSYDLLDPTEQHLMRCLAVFAGGWPLAAAEAVASADGQHDLLDCLTSLVDKSLVWLDDTRGEPRYWMLEVVREFAQEALGHDEEASAIRDRHAAWVGALAETAWTGMMRGAITPWWLTAVGSEFDNIRLALTHLAETAEHRALLRLCGALYPCWILGGFRREGRAWAERALSLDDGGASPSRQRALMCAAGLAQDSDERDTPAAFAGEALSLAEHLGDVWAAGVSLEILGTIALERGAYDEAERSFAAAITKFDPQRDRDWLGLVAQRRANAAYGRGDLDLARIQFEEARRLHRDIGDTWFGADTIEGLARVAIRLGHRQAAAAWLRESLDLRREYHLLEAAVDWLEAVASLAVAITALEPAARLLGASAAFRAALGTPLVYPERADVEATVATVCAVLGEPAFDAAWEAGRAMSLDDALHLGEQLLAESEHRVGA